MHPFLALITPLSDPGGGGGGGGQPPGIWNPVFPSNPIPIYPGGSPNPPQQPGQPPLGIWGPQPGFPSNPIPIYPGGSPNPPGGGGGGNPPGIWGGSNQPFPTNPIAGFDPGSGAFPPSQGNPPGIWGGGNQPFPTNPIAGFDPGTGQFPKPPESPDDPKFEKKVAWTPQSGWVVFYMPTGPSVTPSGQEGEEDKGLGSK